MNATATTNTNANGNSYNAIQIHVDNEGKTDAFLPVEHVVQLSDTNNSYYYALAITSIYGMAVLMFWAFFQLEMAVSIPLVFFSFIDIYLLASFTSGNVNKKNMILWFLSRTVNISCTIYLTVTDPMKIWVWLSICMYTLFSLIYISLCVSRV